MFCLNIKKKISSLFFGFLTICCFTCKVNAHNYCVSVGIIGNYNCGKTTLMNTYLGFDNKYPPHSKNLDFHQFNIETGGDTFLVTLWDTPGDPIYSSVVGSFIRKLDIIIVVFDTYKLASLQYSEAGKDELVRNWFVKVDDYKRNHARVILFGTKTDLVCGSSSYSIDPLRLFLDSVINARRDATWAYSNKYDNSGLIRVMGNSLATSLRLMDKSFLSKTTDKIDLSYNIKTTKHKCSGDTYSLDSK